MNNPISRSIERLIVRQKIYWRVYRDRHIRLRLRINNSLGNPHLVKIIHRGGTSYQVELNQLQLTYEYKGNARAALSCIFRYVLQRGLTSAFADLSDGGHDLQASSPDTNLSFSSGNPRAILIPDHHFTDSSGYEGLRRAIRAQAVPWEQRSSIITWRGSITGDGPAYAEPFTADNTNLMPRVRMCMILAKHPQVDAGIADNYILQREKVWHEQLTKAGITKSPVPLMNWVSHRYAIDIDGHTNAWQNFFSRLLMGCCVIKIASPHHYKQWYYDRLEPWKHYVPVHADMHDLLEKITWCLANEEACAAIGRQAQAMAYQIAAEEFPLND